MNLQNLLKHIEKKNGVFLEAGANDGIFHSYTYALEKEYGWSGVLIEPSKSVYERCIANRGNSVCINAALTDNPDTVELFGDFDGNPMSSVGGERLSRPAQYSIQATTLTKIFDEYFKNTQVDLISIDVENYEYEVLNGLDYDRYTPSFILVEIYRDKFNDVRGLLEKNKYVLVENITNFNYKDNPYWDGTHNDYLFKLEKS